MALDFGNTRGNTREGEFTKLYDDQNRPQTTSYYLKLPHYPHE